MSPFQSCIFGLASFVNIPMVTYKPLRDDIFDLSCEVRNISVVSQNVLHSSNSVQMKYKEIDAYAKCLTRENIIESFFVVILLRDLSLGSSWLNV